MSEDRRGEIKQSENSLPIKESPLYSRMFYRNEEKILSLAKSIKKYGQLHVLFVNERGEILSGYNRREACKLLGIQPTYEVKKFNSKEEEILFALDCNLNDANRTDFEKIEALVLYREPIERRRADERRLRGLNLSYRSPMAQICAHEEEGRVREILAPAANVGPTTFDHGSWLVKNAPEEMKKKLRKGIVSIDRAYTTLHSKSKNQEDLPFTGEIARIDKSVMLVRASLKDVNDTIIPRTSLDLIIPSSDCSANKILAKEVALFSSRTLRKGGFLVLYSKHNSVGKLCSVVSRNSKDLELLQVLTVPFDFNWVNVDCEPIAESNTAVILIFWKRKRADSEHFPPYIFEGPIQIDNEFTDDEGGEEVIRAEKANLYTFDYLIGNLRLSKGMTVCDPACGDGKLPLKVLQEQLNFVGIEVDLEKFQLAKKMLQNPDPESDIESDKEGADWSDSNEG